MPILVVLLPARTRAPNGAGSAVPEPGIEYGYVVSPDGLNVGSSGRAAATALPKADTVVAVACDPDVSWHRVMLPKVPSSRQRAALAGVLEDQLLEDDVQLHFSLAPDAIPGQPAWVAALNKPWLVRHLALLAKAGHFVDRVVPASWPEPSAHGHFMADPHQPDGSLAQTWLVRASGEGVACVRLNGGLARSQLQTWMSQTARWTAEPTVAAQAERWLGAPVRVLSEPERALQALRSNWNMRQFDLAPRHRGMRALREMGKRMRNPAWRPARWGLIAAVVLNLVGLNLWALHQRQTLADKRAEMIDLLRSTHPQVRAVLDPAQQMLRETEALRVAAGRLGEADFEALLGAAALAWPDGRPPVETLRFEGGQLTLVAAGWNEQQIEMFRARLQPAGIRLDASEGRLTLSRRSDLTPGGAS